MLAACSTDGSVAFLSFSEEELGTSLSQEDKVRFDHHRICAYFDNIYSLLCCLCYDFVVYQEIH